MTAEQHTKETLFLDWFKEEYDCGTPYDRNFDRSLAYLQGLMDASEPDSLRFQGLVEVISTLRQCRTVLEILERYKVKAPEVRS
jgi:hypothetical protein